MKDAWDAGAFACGDAAGEDAGAGGDAAGGDAAVRADAAGGDAVVRADAGGGDAGVRGDAVADARAAANPVGNVANRAGNVARLDDAALRAAGSATNFLIGHPVGHSLSPALYRRAYGALGLPWTYEAVDLPDEAAAHAWIEETRYASVNVTTPFKPLALAAATVAGASAQLAGGANLLVRHKDALLGFNVDGQGCLAALASEGFSVEGRAVAICGTGPTAISILHQCLLEGAGRIVLLSRDKARSERVLRGYAEDAERLAASAIDLSAFGGGPEKRGLGACLAKTTLQFGSYQTSHRAIEAAELIVDATTLGMHEGDPAPFDVGLLHGGQWVVDTVYGHGTTALVAAARTAGAVAFDGYGMLVGQAVATLQTLLDIRGVPVTVTPSLFATT